MQCKKGRVRKGSAFFIIDCVELQSIDTREWFLKCQDCQWTCILPDPNNSNWLNSTQR